MVSTITPFWLFLIVGVVLLATELLVFQFTTFWLFFIGLGALVAAAFAWVAGGSTMLVTTGVFVVASAAITAVLYSPIRKWQNAPGSISDNNAIGQKVVVKTAIKPAIAGTVSWSGSDWQAELVEGSEDELAPGQTARVVQVEGIRLIVKA